MTRLDAMMQLKDWSLDELLFRDYKRVEDCEMSQSAFREKWQDHLKEVSYAIDPPDNYCLTENSFISSTYDISIVKARRYSPLFWHRHDFYEIVYVLSGNCDIYIDDDVLHMIAGDFFMLAPNYSHEISIFNEDTIALNIIIRSSTLLDIFLNAIRDKTLISRFLLSHAYSEKSFKYLLFHTRSDEMIRDYILDIYIELEGGDEYSNRIATSLVTVVFTQIVRHYSDTADMPEIHKRNSENSAEIMNYIIDNYSICTLNSISQHLNLSLQYASKYIKSTIGIPFSQLLMEIRIQKAKNLLISTPMKIDAISEYVGYSNPETLIRAFKKTVGVTPSMYRKKHTLTP